MSNFLSTAVGIILSIGSVFAVAVIGGLYVVGLLKGKKDDEDDRLINILDKTVKALQGEVKKQKEDGDTTIKSLNKKIDDLTVKVNELEKENLTLIKVLQGRDEQTAKFYSEAFKSMETAKATHKLVEDMNKNQTVLMTTLIDHLKLGPGINVNVQK